MTNKIEDTLKERGSRYGEFHTQSEYAQGMKRIFQKSPNWSRMTDDQREALDMFANKIGRILNGDPDYGDSWHDIAGYAELVEKRIEERKRLQDEAREAYNKKVNVYLQENGDYDPKHNTSPCSVASVERGEVLGFCPQRPESEMDALAPEVCVSRCY